MSVTEHEHILVTHEPPLGWIVINRSAARNALTMPMWQELATIVQTLSSDDSIRVIILRGAGHQSFIAGADIADLQAQLQLALLFVAHDLSVVKHVSDRVAVMMADLSDSPQDLVRFHRKMDEGYDCVFGSRWIKGGEVIDYPGPKKWMNRLANTIVRIAFRMRYNDCTNAFKLYSRETMEGLKPFLSPHFNLTLELPLKAIVRGYSYAVLPNSWRNRKTGESKLKIKEMGSRYFFIMLYCLIEKFFSHGDFKKRSS